MAAKGYQDIGTLVNSLNPTINEKALKEDVDRAKRVRETLLSYKKQLTASLQILNKHAKEEDQTAVEFEREVADLLYFLDKLEKRKNVTADALLDFMAMMRQVGGQLNGLADDKGNKSGLAEALRARRKEILDDDKKQDKRFQELAHHIGTSVEQFVKEKADLVGAGGGSALKLALASWLGPAAPLVQLVDELVDIDGKVAGLYKGTVNATKKIADGVLALPGKVVKGGGAWTKSVMDYLRARDYRRDTEGSRRDGRTLKLLKDQLATLKDMKGRLSRLAQGAGKLVGNLLLGLGGLLSNATSVLGRVISTGLGALLSALPGKALLEKLMKLVAGGAAGLFKRSGMSPKDAGTAGNRFGKSTFGKALSIGGRALGAAGGAYGVYDAYGQIKEAKQQGKGFFEGGLGSRAAGYAQSMMSGASAGAMLGSLVPGIGNVVGAVVGGAVGTISALVADNEDAIKAVAEGLWNNAKDLGSDAINKASTLVHDWGESLANSPLATAFTSTKDAITTLGSDLGNFTSRTLGWWQTAFDDLMTGIPKSIDKLKDVIGDTVGVFVGEVKSWFDGLDIGHAIKEGLSSGKQWLADKAQSAGLSVVNAADNANRFIQGSTGWNPASALPDGWKKGIKQFQINGNYENVKDDLQDAANRSGVNVGTLARFAQIESSFNANARAGTSSAGGLFQMIDGTWGDTLKKYGGKYGLGMGANKFDPRANALMGAELLKENQRSLQKNVGGNIGDTELYLAHFLGAGGASQFLKAMRDNPNASAASIFPTQAAANSSVFMNKNGSAKSLSDVYKWAAGRIASTDSIAAKAVADAGGVSAPALSGAQVSAGGPTGRLDATQQVADQAQLVPRTPVTPAAPADKAAQPDAAAMPIASLSSKSNLDNIPFAPDDQSLIVFNVAGILG